MAIIRNNVTNGPTLEQQQPLTVRQQQLESGINRGNNINQPLSATESSETTGQQTDSQQNNTGNQIPICGDEQTMSQIEDFQFADTEQPTDLDFLESINFNLGEFQERFRTGRFINPISTAESQNLENDLERARSNLISEEEARRNSIEQALDSLLNSLEQNSISLGGTVTFDTSAILGLGRNKLIIDSQIFGGTTSDLINEYILESSLTSDNIRYYTNSIYSLEPNQKIVFLKNLSPNKYIQSYSLLQRQEASNGSIAKFLETYMFEYGPSLRATDINKQEQLIRAFLYSGSFSGSIDGQNKTTFFFPERLTDIQEVHYDLSFNAQPPFLNNELLNLVNLVGGKVADIIPKYNFFINKYEKIANGSNSLSKENLFPNLYILNELLKEKEDREGALYKSLVTLNDSIPASQNSLSSRQLQNSRSSRIFYELRKNYGKYFDMFGMNYNSLVTNEPDVIKVFNNKNKNILLLSDTLTSIKEINEQKVLFPMNIEVSVPTDKTANVTQMLYSSGLIDNFLVKLYDLTKRRLFEQTQTVTSEQIVEQTIQQQNNNYIEPTLTNSYAAKRSSLSVYSLQSIFDEMLNPLDPESDQESIIIGNKENIVNNSSGNAFENNLKMIILKSKLEDFMKSKIRTYKDILDGKLAYNETIAFRVSKYENNSTIPVQSYWFANDSSQEAINFIDTQVKYNKQYTYKIFSYEFVLGNKYYSQRVQEPLEYQSVNTNRFFLINYQDFYPNIVEVEMLSSTTKIVDSPPLSPEISFIPYNRIDNKMGIFLNGRTGEETVETISILDSDQTIFNTYNKNLHNKVLYRSDDSPKLFHMFRLDYKPRSYSDFNKGLIKSLSTLLDINRQYYAASTTHVDNIEPNKKYYYTFRSVDIHDNISNPSEIYEVEIINDNGAILPIVKLFEFEKPKYDTSKKLRRFLKIQPKVEHVRLNSENVNLETISTAEEALGRVSLGVSDIGVPWGKTFKMVVTSIQSGKKLEIKFKFNYKRQ